ncbi:MAG TPA: accessory regulator AgrB, partial [Syntrophomonadaceae bacterium]|nr:accessory regulator AgrB [Syntrophomonadaceae bacterium]
LLMGWLVKWLKSVISFQGFILLMIITFIAVIAIIWRYAPGETENKPLTEADRVRGKRLSFAVAGILFAVVILLAILKVEQGYGLPLLAGMLCQTFTLTPWGYRFIRWVDGVLSFRGQGGDSGELEGSDSR